MSKTPFQPCLKPPFQYHMGKNMMARHIVPMIPPHRIYCEPFVGSAAIFFAKHPAKIEVLNDLNANLVAFYKAAKEDSIHLLQRIRSTPYSCRHFEQARKILQSSAGHSDLTRAWAVFTVYNMAMFGDPQKSFKVSKRDNVSAAYLGKKQRLIAMAGRLDHTVLECRDALKVIQMFDDPDAFFFVDPPYYNAGIGTENYTADDFTALLDMLAGLSGCFLLTCYDNEIIRSATARHRWHTRYVKRTLAYGARNTVKTEVITTNYLPE
jgi:DNA adenine methylase